MDATIIFFSVLPLLVFTWFGHSEWKKYKKKQEETNLRVHEEAKKAFQASFGEIGE